MLCGRYLIFPRVRTSFRRRAEYSEQQLQLFARQSCASLWLFSELADLKAMCATPTKCRCFYSGLRVNELDGGTHRYVVSPSDTAFTRTRAVTPQCSERAMFIAECAKSATETGRAKYTQHQTRSMGCQHWIRHAVRSCTCLCLIGRDEATPR